MTVLYPTIQDYESHYDPGWLKPFPEVDREYVWTYPISLRAMTGAELCRPSVDLPSNNRLSIYVHIPYCQSECPFCAFLHVAAKVDFTRYANCVAKEAGWYAHHPCSRNTTLSAIYFGGGTASLLRPAHIARILGAIREGYRTHPNLEVTVECHPDSIDSAYLSALPPLGVTRLSLGIQSFQPRFLRAIGRKQNVANATAILDQALQAEFRTVSIDLMYRLPKQTNTDVLNDLRCATRAGVQSISMYSLEASDTLFESRGAAAQPDEAAGRHAFESIRHYLCDAGYVHFAQPDYALPGHEQRYLTDLWCAPQAMNLGLGAGAMSGFFAGFTYCNLHDPDLYMQAVETNSLPILLGQRLDRRECLARYLVLGVRGLQVPLSPFEELFGVPASEPFRTAIEKLTSLGLVAVTDDRLALTSNGEYYVDTVSKHFYTERNHGKRQPWGCHFQHFRPTGLFSMSHLWERSVNNERDESRV